MNRDEGPCVVAAYRVGGELLLVRRSDRRLCYRDDTAQSVEVDCILREDRSPMTLDLSGHLEEQYACELVFAEVVRLWGRKINGVTRVPQTAPAA